MAVWRYGGAAFGERIKILDEFDAMERHGHLDMDPIIRSKVLQVSATTIDRMLAAARMREQMLIFGAFEQVAGELPFAMLGVDSNNDSAFMSQSVFDCCKGHGLVQTRLRAYKTDQTTAAGRR